MRFVLLALTVLATISGIRTLASDTGGVFVDSKGGSHSWTINEAHALLWDNSPYLPTGLVFTPRFFYSAESEENWQADVSALKAIKQQGINDLIIHPVKGSTTIAAGSWQKVIDYLESEGFRYGINLADQPKKPLTAWIIQPNVYRQPDIQDERTVTLKAPGLTGGIALLADAKSSEVVRVDKIKPSGDQASVEVRGSPEAKTVLLAYPIRTISSDVGLPNLWEEYGEYRDRIVAHFSSVKFGSGMRFWISPYSDHLSFQPEYQGLIPTSKSYQVEFESFLRKKYRDLPTLARVWGLGGGVKSYEDASRLIPLWRGRKGILQVYDTASGQTLKLNQSGSRMWDDIEEFRTLSVRQYLNNISVALKKSLANVPVIVNAASYDSLFVNDEPNGFDGIGLESYGSPAETSIRAAETLALAEQAKRSHWLVVTGTNQGSGGYGGASSATGSLSAFKDAGFKGFFVKGAGLPESLRSLDILIDPKQIGWLRDYQNSISTEMLLADWKPRTVWYSREMPFGAKTKRLERDLWWLPKLGGAETVPVEPGLSAYIINDAAGVAVFVWTTGQPREIEIPTPQGLQPLVSFTGLEERQVKVKKKSVIIPINNDPAIIRQISPSAFMTSAGLTPQVDYLDKLIRMAEGSRLLVGQYKMALDTAKHMIKSGKLPMAATTLRTSILELEPQVAPFDWVEGENASETSFLDTGVHPDVSGSKYLSIDTDLPAPLIPYCASFPVLAAQEADYQIWVAGSPIGDPEFSPVSWNVDESSWIAVTDPKAAGPSYGPGFRWTNIGSVHLTPGRHVIRFRLDQIAASSARYRMAIDAMLITREPFVPNGPEHPQLQ